MPTPKQETLERVTALPDDATTEEILYELYFQAKIRRGLVELERGETISHEEVMKEVGQWLASAGR